MHAARGGSLRAWMTFITEGFGREMLLLAWVRGGRLLPILLAQPDGNFITNYIRVRFRFWLCALLLEAGLCVRGGLLLLFLLVEHDGSFITTYIRIRFRFW